MNTGHANLTSLVNTTPHPITIRRADGSAICVPPSDKYLLLMTEETHEIANIDGVPVYSAPQFMSIYNARGPEMPSDCDILVSMPVGNFVAQYPDADEFKTLTVYGPDTNKHAIRDGGKIIGTCALICYKEMCVP